MLDMTFIREHPDAVRTALSQRNTTAPLDEVLRFDQERRDLLSKVEQMRAQRNATSKEIGRMKDATERERQVVAMRELGDDIGRLEERLQIVEAELQGALLQIPNIPDPDVPVGPDEHSNAVIRTWGEPRAFDFEPVPHWDLGPSLGILDFERGVKLSGSRFYVLKGLGARLQRAVITWMLDVHTQEHGYSEIYPPSLIRPECLVGTGQLPKYGDNLYHDTEDDLWLSPTAEVTVTNLYREEILPPGSLPIYHAAYSPCFRREKMAAGRDVRGIKRGHQFDKVEMVKFVAPETSDAELDTLTANAEDICRRLEIPYRVVQLCTGDLSFQAVKAFDLEMWAPGCQEWLEVSSCSNCGDFQARRANIRFRRAAGARVEFVHTLNGSGLALPRVMIAIMENYQRADGRIDVPVALRPYVGTDVIG